MPRKCKQASSSGAKSASKVQAGQTVGACVRELRSFKKPNKYGLKLSSAGGGTRTPTPFLAADKMSAANSRIKDIDVAEESTSFAKYNILVQAGTAMLSQANSSSQSVLRLLG